MVVTLDPWRDTPERLASLASHWRLAQNDRVLSGAVQDVESALDKLGIARTRDEMTGDVTHATTVMVLDLRGRITLRADGGGDTSELFSRIPR
jgi:cytochrome oxidase Cu insertion factor (SCO1/SenC/PrrC family)